jgi:hypothetical protein
MGAFSGLMAGATNRIADNLGTRRRANDAERADGRKETRRFKRQMGSQFLSEALRRNAPDYQSGLDRDTAAIGASEASTRASDASTAATTQRSAYLDSDEYKSRKQEEHDANLAAKEATLRREDEERRLRKEASDRGLSDEALIAEVENELGGRKPFYNEPIEMHEEFLAILRKRMTRETGTVYEKSQLYKESKARYDKLIAAEDAKKKKLQDDGMWEEPVPGQPIGAEPDNQPIGGPDAAQATQAEGPMMSAPFAPPGEPVARAAAPTEEPLAAPMGAPPMETAPPAPEQAVEPPAPEPRLPALTPTDIELIKREGLDAETVKDIQARLLRALSNGIQATFQSIYEDLVRNQAPEMRKAGEPGPSAGTTPIGAIGAAVDSVVGGGFSEVNKRIQAQRASSGFDEHPTRIGG